MKLEIKYIQPGSLVLSALPVVLFVLGAVGGLVAFVIVPNPMIEPMTAVNRLLATGVFALTYTVLILALIVGCCFVYNMLCSVMGLKGVRVSLEEVGEEEGEAAPQ